MLQEVPSFLSPPGLPAPQSTTAKEIGSVFTKYGNRPILCSTLNAANAQLDYLSEDVNKIFVEALYQKDKGTIG